MRLIDGNKIVMSLADWWYSSFRQEETEESKAIKKVMYQVEKMVVEMPEIVRCKDCSHRIVTDRYKHDEGMTRSVYDCDKGIIHVNKDYDYCSYGEKQVTGKLESVENATSEGEESTMGQPKSKLGSDLISRQAAIEALGEEPDIVRDTDEEWAEHDSWVIHRNAIASLPPVEDMGEVSDGYHTFNQLYHQRAVLFATIVNQNKDKAWKSWKHEDGHFCFDKGGEWFIVGVDTPEGSYTYHYEKKYWDLFDCEELDRGKHWDGHTEDDVIRLLSLPPVEPKRPKTTETMMVDGEPTEIDPLSYEVGYSHGQSERPKGEWIEYRAENPDMVDYVGGYACSECGEPSIVDSPFCAWCGADMRGDKE